MAKQPFSVELERWLKSKGPKKIDDLDDVFGEKAFGLAFLLLLFIPALPLPTGGITHVTELIAMLLALEMIIGRHTIWLPKRWRGKTLGHVLEGKALPFIMRRVRWFERWSRPRLSNYLDDPISRTLIGIVVLGLSLAAFVAPPFSGLDTLPALGVVIISLGIILEDVVLLLFGLAVGIAGVALIISAGLAISNLWHHFLG